MTNPRIYQPDPRYRTLLAINVLLVFLVFVAPFALIALAPEVGPGFLLWFLVGNALWIAVALILIGPYVRSIEYELGEQELIVRRGIITQATDLVPYHMITNVALRRGPVARTLGLGTLKVHTAGYSGTSNAEASVAGVANYEELREAIITRVRAMGAQQPQGVTPLADAERDPLLALLEEVRGLRTDLAR
jgi:hypothetical protein